MPGPVAVVNIGQLVTLAGPARPRVGVELRDLAIITNAALLIENGCIAATGSYSELKSRIPPHAVVIDAQGCCVTPGFVDAHTHLVFAGNRADEFEKRIAGATYQQIAAAGGGILRTVKLTRAASEDELLAAARRHRDWMLRGGTTTLEAKSGYGLDRDTELRMLRVLARLNQEGPARIVPTLLREFADAWPRVEVQLTEQPGDHQLLEAIERGELDLAFTMYPLQPGPFEAAELLHDPYVLAVPTAWPIGRRAAVRLGDLSDVPLIGNRNCHHAGLQAEEILRQSGIEPKIVFRTDDNGTLQGLVAAQMGVALAPLLSLDEHDPGVRILRLDELPLRTILIAWHRDRYRSPAARAFVEAAKHVCARLQVASPEPRVAAGGSAPRP